MRVNVLTLLTGGDQRHHLEAPRREGDLLREPVGVLTGLEARHQLRAEAVLGPAGEAPDLHAGWAVAEAGAGAQSAVGRRRILRTAASRGCVDLGALDDTTGRASMFSSRAQIVQF